MIHEPSAGPAESALLAAKARHPGWRNGWPLTPVERDTFDGLAAQFTAGFQDISEGLPEAAKGDLTNDRTEEASESPAHSRPGGRERGCGGR